MAQKFDPEVIFFLGAGASAKAGVPDTYKLVAEFREDIKNDTDTTRTVNRIVEILERWKHENDPEDDRVDVELLLEALDKLESRDRDLLLRFYEKQKYVLEDYPEKGEITKKLRAFIKKRARVDREAISYLQPFLAMLNGYSPLSIFSVNYDILIEQFATFNKKQLSDGFEIEWNRASFERSRDIRLYKLHGSVTWYKTKQGDYVKVPVLTDQDEINLITGETATSLILYPMHKWDYDEPLLDLLLLLKDRLQTAKYCIVVGYSFRDEHITRVFWDAARSNRDLHLVLISPHSPATYSRRLKPYGPSADPRILSPLSGRVVCLPYKFEDVFFELTTKLLFQLINGLRQERDARTAEIALGKADWRDALKSFIEAEHYEKAVDLLDRYPWESMPWSWQDRLQYSFKLWLISTIRMDERASTQWSDAFQSAISSFDVNKLVPYVVNQVVAIRFESDPVFTANQLQDAMVPLERLAAARARMVSEQVKPRIAKVATALANITSYLALWYNGSILIPKYIELRQPVGSGRKALQAVFDDIPGTVSGTMVAEAGTEVKGIELKKWTDLMIALRGAMD